MSAPAHWPPVSTPEAIRQRVLDLLATPPPAAWRAGTRGRATYLDLMESLIRYQAATSIQADGTALDTVNGRVNLSDRFACGAAILLHFGRLGDLRELAFKTMTVACRDLSRKKAWQAVTELCVAYHCLQTVAPAALLAEWRDLIAPLVPAQIYGKDLDLTHNWRVYICTGEALRAAFGLIPPTPGLHGNALFDHYMASQLAHLSELGMYRDPGEPITYDITTRLKFATALAFGYDGSLRSPLDAALERAGFATLLFMSPGGYCPFGGRSDQMLFQEAMVAALCELAAKRHGASHPQLAGAFRRQAQLCAQSMDRWLRELSPPRSIKNGFLPEAHHGYDGYRQYSRDLDFCAGLLGLAALFADEAIAEAPCPAELGGYVLHLSPAFHKIIATVGGTTVVIETQAEQAYNATGLGRFAAAGIPLELGLGMPLAKAAVRWGAPAITMAPGCQPPAQDLTIGPLWPVADGWQSLASLSEGLSHTVLVSEETPSRVRFTVTYTWQIVTVTEDYDLQAGQLTLRTRVTQAGQPVPCLRYTVPLLLTDGQHQASTSGPHAGTVRVAYIGHCYTVQFPPAVPAELLAAPGANRQGLYQTLLLSPASHELTLTLTLGPATG